MYNLAPLYWTWRDGRESRKQERRSLSIHSMGSSNQKISDPSILDPEAQGDKPRCERQRELPDTVKSMSEATAVRFTSSVSTVTACLLPVVAIAVLTQVKGERNLLLCITAFAIIFAVG